MHPLFLAWLTLSVAIGCTPKGTEPPPGGWAHSTPTLVFQALDRGESQLLLVKRNSFKTWVVVPNVGAKADDHVLLSMGTERSEVESLQLEEPTARVLDIAHILVTDAETSSRVALGIRPKGALSISQVYESPNRLNGERIVVHGTVTSAERADGSVWIHLQDRRRASGELRPLLDLTVQSKQMLLVHQPATFEGVLRKDQGTRIGDLSTALLENATLVDSPL